MCYLSRASQHLCELARYVTASEEKMLMLLLGERRFVSISKQMIPISFSFLSHEIWNKWPSEIDAIMRVPITCSSSHLFMHRLNSSRVSAKADVSWPLTFFEMHPKIMCDQKCTYIMTERYFEISVCTNRLVIMLTFTVFGTLAHLADSSVHLKSNKLLFYAFTLPLQ